MRNEKEMFSVLCSVPCHSGSTVFSFNYDDAFCRLKVIVYLVVLVATCKGSLARVASFLILA